MNPHPVAARRPLLAVAVSLALLFALASGSGRAQDRLPYRDADRPVPERVADLLGRMTLEEKVGQMTQIDLSRLMGTGEWDRGPLDEAWLEHVLGELQVGSLLSGGNAAPVPNDPAGWAAATEEAQRFALARSRLGIPLLYGVDAVHGHANVLGATVYPHNVGLAATFDPDLVRRIGRAVGEDVVATGVTWNFAPVADLGRDGRWGRFYETFGESPALAGALTAAYVEGQTGVPRLAVTLKHFIGYGQAPAGDDRAPADLSMRELRGTHLPPFVEGLRAGAQTIMINSGSVNGVPVHASRYLLTDLLRDELGFGGVALSDWADVRKLWSVHRVARDEAAAVAMAVNAGVDVVMVPHDAAGFTAALLQGVHDGAVPEARIDEAVGRVLALKFALGLFEEPFPGPGTATDVIEEDRFLARQAVLQSITLLENRGGALPLGDTRRLLVTGPGADDVALQMGGWTLGWQGVPPGGDTPPAVTVLQGLRDGAPEGVEVEGRPPGAADLFERAGAADAVVAVLGEPPYAETPGDSDDLRLPPAQEAWARELVAGLAGSDATLVLVLLAGRPIDLPPDLHAAAGAVVMAYLPGSEAGTALAEVLYGRASPSGRLPFTWPDGVGQLPLVGDAPLSEAVPEPRYELGHGLSYTRFSYAGASARRVDDEVLLQVTVANTGARAGDDVVLVWAEFPVLSILTPERRLVGFGRVTLAAGESRRVDIRIPLARLALVPGDVQAFGEAAVLMGDYRFRAGSESAEVFLPSCRVRDAQARCR